MFTVCPKCALTLVVTAADLRVAQGFVRCGRCSNVFNALAGLSEDRQAAAAKRPGATPTPGGTPAPEPDPLAEEQDSPPETSSITDDEEGIPDTALEFNPDSTDVSEVFIELPRPPAGFANTGRFESIVLHEDETPDAEQDAAPEATGIVEDVEPTELEAQRQPAIETPEITFESEAQTPAPKADTNAGTERPAAWSEASGVSGRYRSPVSASSGTTAEEARPSFQSRAMRETNVGAGAARRTPVEPARTARPAERAPESVFHIPPPDTRGRIVWRIGAGVMALVLAMQIAHHYRHDLAVYPRLNAPLTSLYRALEIPLVPRWDIAAYDVRQLGASADSQSAGRLTVRASLRNDADRPQPLPLLRVTVQDRFGNRVASGDVPPRSYLPATVPATAFLSAGQRIDAEMAFVDPGQDAVGFEIDACLPAPGGRIACANDLERR